jgi:hypothetical protein
MPLEALVNCLWSAPYRSAGLPCNPPPSNPLLHLGRQAECEGQCVDVFHPNTGEVRSDGAEGKEKIKVRYVPITRKVTGKEHHITLGPYGEYSGHLVEGGMGSLSKITNPTGADPIRKEYYQGRTSKYAYNDAGQKWSWKASNYMWNKFDVTSEDYQKFAAGLSQKMQQMPKK